MKFAQTGSDDIKGAHPQPEPKRSVASSWCQGLQWSKDRSPGGGCCKNLTEVFIMVRKSFINPMIFLWYSIYVYHISPGWSSLDIKKCMKIHHFQLTELYKLWPNPIQPTWLQVGGQAISARHVRGPWLRWRGGSSLGLVPRWSRWT